MAIEEPSFERGGIPLFFKFPNALRCDGFALIAILRHPFVMVQPSFADNSWSNIEIREIAVPRTLDASQRAALE